MPTTVARAIYSGMGIADDPDVDDYYTRACGFPTTYSPDDNPEVVEEMHIAAAELKKGGDNSEDEAMEDSLASLSDDSDGVASGEGKGGAEEDWEDENENAGKSSAGPSKRNQKTLSSVKKVCESYCLV
jgi:hypothetical protein